MSLCIELSKCKLDAADWQVEESFLKIGTGAGEQSDAAKSIAGFVKSDCQIKVKVPLSQRD